MQDKEIRKILIEYLKIKHKEYRIYQEKSIGSSICDLMLVTDKLTGFEIKSDSDNYERLPRQVTAYNQFFDENYIVVGMSHAKSAEGKLPPEWGILAINQYSIEVVREAKPNKTVKRIKQLSILWKIELKNILLKNRLPLYAQKEKPFFCEKISSDVESGLLGRQIAEELLNRDYSVFDAEDYTIKSGKFEDKTEERLTEILFPADEMIDRLSEENLSEFTLDKWMSIYKRAVEKQKLKVERTRQVEQEQRHRQKVLHKIPYTDIEVSLGVPWVSAEIISQFAIEVFQVTQQYYYTYDSYLKTHYPDKKIPIVQHEKITGYWHVEKYKNYNHKELVSIYGTKRFNAMQILECTLNLRQIKIHDGTKYNEMETLAAIEKQKAIQDAFKEWIWKDEDRRWEVEEAYNNLFGEYETIVYDGSGIEFAGMNPNITLFDYQKNAVQKIISTPNTLLSFDVGAGKTYIMIAAAMEMRKSGLSRKNMFVVPNNIVGQWEKMFTDLYPKAKVLTVEPKSFTPEKRKKVLSQIQKGDYDGIIMAYSCFEMIPISTTYLLDDMQDSLRGFEGRISELRSQVFPNAAKSIQNEIQYIKKMIDDLIGCIGTTSKSELCFNDLEINTLFVDEAHNFKNIPLRTTMRNIRGINTTGSKKCLEMLKKVHIVQENNGGRGVVFATGTPLCNSISDTYAMQCYLQHDSLKEKGLDRFDNWVKTFARPEEVCEIDVDTSGFRIVHRFAKFFNLPELSKMFGQISIFHNVSQEGLPKLLGYTDVVIDKSEALDSYMQEIYARTLAIRNGEVDRKKDNMLKISTDGRKAALSLALVDKEQTYDEQSKIYHCVKNVMEIYRQYDGCSQLVFCDYSTPKQSKYSVYKELKEHFEEYGVPSKEIAFIHSCKNEEQKVQLYDAVNSGKVRILIGSTFKLGIGANVQTKLKVIHHLDVPWRPADMVQREGRILRRGNENEEINIFRYIVEGSFDSYSWQILQTKQHFISQFLSGNNTVRSIEDFENDELNYAQVKALALSEPLMKEYAEKENELNNARIVLRQELEQKESVRNEIKRIDEDFAKLKRQLEWTKQNAEYVAENLEKFKAQYAEVAEKITKTFPHGKPEEFVTSICDLANGFWIRLPQKQSENKPFVIFKRLYTDYYVEVGESLAGNKKRLANFFAKFDNQITAISKRIDKLNAKKKELGEQLKYSSQMAKKVERLETELAEIFSRISMKE